MARIRRSLSCRVIRASSLVVLRLIRIEYPMLGLVPADHLIGVMSQTTEVTPRSLNTLRNRPIAD